MLMQLLVTETSSAALWLLETARARLLPTVCGMSVGGWSGGGARGGVSLYANERLVTVYPQIVKCPF